VVFVMPSIFAVTSPTRNTPMSWCASCGLALSGGSALCLHHAASYGEDWARANKIVCDLIHRGVAPARLPPEDLDNWYAIAEAAAS
jgi:hypothetical protein